jgi:hypothetical protein
MGKGYRSNNFFIKGMIKMYKAEVLGKHPVIKHQYFGTIIPF